MKKYLNIILPVLIALAVVGGGFYLYKTGKLQLGKLFERQLQPKVEEQLPATSTEKLSEEVVESLNGEKTESLIETEGAEEESSGVVSQAPLVASPQRQLSLAEIQQQINVIKLKVDLLTIEVKIYNIQQEAKQLQFAEVQQQVNALAEKVDNLNQQVTQFAAENTITAQVAGATEELPFTGGPIQDVP